MVFNEPVLRVDTDPAAVDGVVDGQVGKRRRRREVDRGVFQGVDPNLVVSLVRWGQVWKVAPG